MKKIVSTEKAPRPVGPYSQAICVNGWLYVSGQIPLDPVTGDIVRGDFKVQVERVLENIRAIVESTGGRLEDVVKVTVYLRDIGRFSEFNEVYSKYFPRDPPARSVIGVSSLPRGVELEIDAVAYVGNC
ncbi:MAG: RidA family protein [Desulfurococcaceae archaeon]|nr:RidA family protein [Desulfurococcaceae archaeon]